MRLLLAVVCAACATLSPPAAEQPEMLRNPPGSYRSYRATFESCYDGDTCDFTVHLGLSVRTRQTVRLYGIDTPELRGDERNAGMKVRNFVVRILQSSHQIELLVPQRRNCGWADDDCDERGKYGRLLANVVADGQSLNALLLATRRATLY